MKASVVLCMAGTYRRFREAGYTTPKFLLDVGGGRTVLQWVIEGLAPDRVLLVANQRDEAHEAALRAVLEATGTPEADLFFIGDTSGQAETAAIGARGAAERGWYGPLVFHNIDTVLEGRDLGRIGRVLSTSDGFIDVFESDSPAYSYVAVDDARRVQRIAEKVVISNLATTGLYGFASPAAYLAAAEATTGRSKGEFYVSDVYQQMLDRGATLIAGELDPAHRTVILGTPAEYEAWMADRT